MKKYIFLKVFFIFSICSSFQTGSTSEDGPIVSTQYGKVMGIRAKEHFEFRRIPFAAPPVGPLRFKPPVPPDPWPGVLPANHKFPEYCIQFNTFWNMTEGVEDCLYVNVFTPIDPSKGKNKLPVMVYIHSGGFMFGRGSHFRADYLMETKKVVAVVFQYRLGSFGFLNTEDEESYGNMGMKDQTMALKWVNRNVDMFGGDPTNVMIFGTSAGAASVHYHILSPLSKGLFHSAFSGSGTALCPWAFQRKPKENALLLGKYLDCPTQTTKLLVDCLRTKSYDEIGYAHSKFLQWNVDPIAAFGPSLEVGNPDPSTTAFIHAHPADIIEKGEINEVPWILGYDSDEGYEHTLSILKHEHLVQELNEKWEQVFPITLEYVHEPERNKADISKKVRQFYLNNQKVCQTNLKNLSNAYSDKTYVLCTIRSAFKHANLGRTRTHPIYLFQFDYHGESSIVTLRGYPNEGFGCTHMDDIQYLVNSPLFEFIEEGSKDKPFQKKYVDMITTFAATGKIPAFSQDNPENTWQPLDPGGSIKWYHITANPKMEPMSAEWSKRMSFWDQFDLQEYATALTYAKYNKEEL